MTSKTISLSEKVYAKLEAERAEGESFNSVIERLTRKRSLMDIVGFLKEEEAEELGRVIDELRAKSSDVDILVRFLEGATLFDQVGLANFLEEKLAVNVDVVSERAVREELRDQILKEMVLV